VKNRIQKLLLFFISIFLFSCVENSTDNFDNEIGTIKNGIWRAVFEVNDSTKIPILFGITNDGENVFFEIINNNESTFRSIVKVEKDSFFIQLPFYKSRLAIKHSENKLKGKWISVHENKEKTIPFYANQNYKGKFISLRPAKDIKAETWKVFSSEKPDFLGFLELSQTNEKISININTPFFTYKNLDGTSDNKRRNYFSYFNGQNLIYATSKKMNDSEMIIEIIEYPKSNTKKYIAKKQSAENKLTKNISYQNETVKAFFKQEFKKLGIDNISQYQNIIVTGTWNLKGESMWKKYNKVDAVNDSLITKSLFLFVENEETAKSFVFNNEEDVVAIFIQDETFANWNTLLKEIKNFPAIFEVSKKGEILYLN
jgi:hypothetical protein